MTAHLKMDKPDTRNRLDHTAQGLIGAGMDRPDGKAKVTGTAAYAFEDQPEGMAHGVLVRANVAKGRLNDIDRDSVLRLPGVLAAMCGPRFLRNPAQGGANEAPVQGSEGIAYLGQPVALVVAETFEQARHAAHMLTLQIDAQEGQTDPDIAGYESPDAKQAQQGDLDRAMKDAATAIDVTYTTPSHNSAAMEPHAAIAEWDQDMLTLRGSYQMLKYNRNELADALGIDPKCVRILAPYVGGGFGSKLGIAPEAVAAALAAHELNRPVGVALTRQQVFEGTMRRSESRQRVRLAADASGKLQGIGHDAYISNLTDEVFSEPVTQATPFIYAGENRVIGHHIARVNRTCAGSVRAPGESIGVTVLENAMDELAHQTGIDPVELRLMNIPDKNPTSGLPFSSHTLAEALTTGRDRFGWDQRNPQPGSTRKGDWLIGMGMASAVRVNILSEARVRVTLMPDGTARVQTDMTDIGTGTYAILTQICAEMLGLPETDVSVSLGDTDHPPGPGSGGSWGASSVGTAAFLACEKIRRELAKKVDADEADLTLKDGMVSYANRQVRLADMIDEEIEIEGHVEPGDTSDDVTQSTYGAHFAEVAVNAVTGETRVQRMLGVFAAGRILNHKTARSQCLGGMTFGLGMALTEELMHDPRDGHIVNRDLAEYHLPVNLDVPQLDVVLLDERDAYANPLQSKGIGELGICGAAAAITNAIFNATGVRVRDYPATLDKVLAGL
ncbi:xanthine dehydrogenase family protein molybdopterin-binding subunit [Pseudosulfitobacter koreensis]|uniref:Xanthine dehydrogenase family protein molybdopterin-binding subunit n=1 Tax=Pseudosulfitobacter koreensis TaxID=2968472 RepID=A0ABT1Z0P8_9RHOB|nr:xanthine dehydrogenase family protein molybdopterin-binding subunit [Pseudosulfitobacter koreense]MCR8826690.1 xanthine dehydrogenase family protein molybdopterin-binding subunit [Pseudosulfitobacter koreense]